MPVGAETFTGTSEPRSVRGVIQSAR